MTHTSLKILFLALPALAGCRAALGGSNLGVAARPDADRIVVAVAPPQGDSAPRLAQALDAWLAADARVTRVTGETCDAARTAGATYLITASVSADVDPRITCVREELSLDKNPKCAESKDETDAVRVKAAVDVTDVGTCTPSQLGMHLDEVAVGDDHAAATDSVVTKALAALQSQPLFPGQAHVASMKGDQARMDIEPGAVTKDEIFVAYRGEERVGRLIVTKVESDHATLEGLSGGITPKAGDALVPGGKASWWELAPRLTIIFGSRSHDGDAGSSLPAGGGGLQLRRSPTGDGLVAGIGGDVVEAGSGGTAALGGVEAGWRKRRGPRTSAGLVGGVYAARLARSGHAGTTWTATAGFHILHSTRWMFLAFELGYLHEAAIEWERNTESAGELAFGGLFLRLALGLSL